MPVSAALPAHLSPQLPAMFAAAHSAGSGMVALLPLALFAFVTSITPGPNNLMLTASSIRFGFRRTILHMLGVVAGLSVMLALFGSGVGSLILAIPSAQAVLKLASACYLVWLAWQMRALGFAADQHTTGEGRPMSFLHAVLFQFANPKAWMMVLTAAASFMPALPSAWLSIAVLCLVFGVIGLPCVALWAGAGAILGRYLQQAHWRRLFCALMMGLTLYTAAAIYL